MKELVIKKCLKCGALVKVIADCHCDNCGIDCCGEPMKELRTNSTDGAIEKYKPEYTIENNELIVTVNHVMDEDHYIMWIKFVYANSEKTFFFKPGDEIEADSRYEAGMKIYAYCNIHGLWVREVV